MSMFGNLTTEGLEESGDSLGGQSAFAAGVYEATVKAYYGTVSDKGSKGVTVLLDIGGKEYRETLWVVSKDGNNFYHPKKKGTQERDTTKKIPLMGFVVANDIALMTAELELNSLSWETKKVKEFDFKERKDKLIDVQMAVEPIGKKILVAIQNTLEDVTKEVNGQRVATGETRNRNSIEKVAHGEKRVTMSEARNKSEALFMDEWEKKYGGKVIDRSTKTGIQSGSPAGSAGGGASPAKSLFDD